MTAMQDTASLPSGRGMRPTRTRHTVLWLTVAAYMVTYMDRVVISVAAPSIQDEFGFSVVTMGWIFFAFQISYALFQVPGGWLGDRFGPRRALTWVVTWWSVFTAATALTWSATSMIIARFLFGMGEAGAFPIATRSLSRWMLPSERGWAQGLTHAGSRFGAALTPVFVVMLIGLYGWRAPFFLFALIGLLWAGVWFWYYRDSPAEHSSVNEAERTMIAEALGHRQTKKRFSVPWKQILSNPQMWLLAAMYFCYAYCISLFLTWFPTYLNDARGFDLATMGLFASAPLAAAVLGDLAGGYVSDHLVKRDWGLKLARRLVAVVGFGIAAVLIPVAVNSADMTLSIICFCIAVFGLELTVGVSWAVSLDVGGEYAGSVSAVMNTCGNIGGAIAGVLTGYIVAEAGWGPAFYVPSALCVMAAIIFLRLDASSPLFVEPAEADVQ